MAHRLSAAAWAAWHLQSRLLCRQLSGTTPWASWSHAWRRCNTTLTTSSSTTTTSSRSGIDVETEVADTLKVASLIRRFRARGHLVAQLDPLGRTAGGPWLGPTGDEYSRSDHTLLKLLTDYPHRAHVDERAAFLGRQLGLAAPATGSRLFCVGGAMPDGEHPPFKRQHWSLPEVFEAMRARYCGTLAVEYKHLFQQDEMEWMQACFEERTDLSPEERRLVLQQLQRADMLERMLAEKFPASKRFGLEGCEALLPGLLAMVQRSAQHGVERFEIGMAHRGRLNVLVNLLGKPFGALCTEMEGRQSEFRVGDVKYHLGVAGTLEVTTAPESGPREVRLSIAPNPSHLEAVAPVVLGMVRAEQAALNAEGQGRVMGLLIHGDAAFAGLGSVAECLQLADVPGFTTGGTIHVVINNQVGFTTMPRYARSSPHPTSVVKMIGAPILHANADDPDAVVEAFLMAADWRNRWHKDVVVDLVGYRRNGHNELDDPSTTLPRTSRLIASHPKVLELYTAALQEAGVVSHEEVLKWEASTRQYYDQEWQAATEGKYNQSAAQFLVSSWQGDALTALASQPKHKRAVHPLQEPTGLPLQTLQRVGEAISRLPKDIQLHKDVVALQQARRGMMAGPDSRVDWAMAEALAFGTLMLHRQVEPRPEYEGVVPLGWGLNQGHYNVRLTGQDVERGTFNQRHAVLFDQATGERHIPLNTIQPDRQECLEVWNSPLSEAAVLGFEYGFSLGAKDTALVCWDAQFGDFANNAQVIIDQFISSGEEKWQQQSGLVVLLPHGYDGQGPDHSSARMERFLQLCNDDADYLPGTSPAQRKLMRDTFEAVAKAHGGKLHKHQVLDLLAGLGVGVPSARGPELAELLWDEMGLPEGAPLSRAAWERFMVQYIRRNAEREANMFVVNATTPAQYFHALRRQLNLPHKKPLILFSPKYLLHHRPATSALMDFTTGHFFNRVIDDGKASDNTRHLAINPHTREPHLLPPGDIRRVILCTGQIYYHLSRERRRRRIRDVVLVRLEQIAPFPHDLMTRVVAQYTNAQLMWVQEEPKNMGAWGYVKPRLQTALRELNAQLADGGGGAAWAARAAERHQEAAQQEQQQQQQQELQRQEDFAGIAQQRQSAQHQQTEQQQQQQQQQRQQKPWWGVHTNEVVLHYMGRPAAASPATASFAISQKETADIVNAALTL